MLWMILFIIPVQANSVEIAQNITSSPCSDRYHIFLAPGVLTAGGTSRTCVSRFYTDGSALMTITLAAEDGLSTSAIRQLTPGDGGCLDISVPQKPNSKVELNVQIRYPEAKCTWERRISLRISSSRVVVVHTERARYRPGDTLRIRAIALKADLTPAHSNIDEIWLEGPQGAWDGLKVAQWRRARTRLGLAQLRHELDELAPPGKWAVRARLADGSEGSTAFWVGNYELPPFQLTVRHAPRILRTSERLVWTVCVRYPWSEAVEGMLLIRLRGAGGASGGIRTAVRLKAPRACHRHAAASKRIGLNGNNPPDVVIADFSFQEDATRIWQNTTVVSQVVDEPVTLEFLTKHRALITPGLPYKIKIRATRWDDKPASKEKITMCRSPAYTLDDKFNTHKETCVDSITDEKGIARVSFTADDDACLYYNFEARLRAARARLRAVRGAGGGAALGALRGARGRELLALHLALPLVRAALTVHFAVITRGGIIYRWGATTQCPTTDQTQTSPRNGICPSNQRVSSNISEVDSLMDRQHKIMLPIKVSHQMCPDSHLVAYFYHNDQLITASKHFEIDDCFANTVETKWANRQIAPGAPATLHIATPGPALCALSVLDVAAQWSTPAVTVKELLMSGLRELMEGHRNLTEHDAAGECFLTSDSPEVPESSIELLSSWLASAGVRFLGGDNPQRHCSASPARLVADDVVVPRSDFSESWLWRLVAVGSNGSVAVTARAPDSITRFEANAVCLAKTGVAVSQPAILQVFRELFLHAGAARRLRRGDSAVLAYRIFNYMYEPLSIEITVNSTLLSDPSVERACVAPRASTARRLTLTANETGSAKLRIRVVGVDGDCGKKGNGVSDEVILRIEVDPEGVPVLEPQSALLCGADSRNFTSTSDVSWSWQAASAVPGTEFLTVWATGDFFGPLLADADALTQLPRGCGEQNMARLATNLLALQMMRPGQRAQRARDHVARGVTRQLQYAHLSGGFSAFGPSEPPSAWLTAFCLRYLRKAYEVLSGKGPVPPVITRSERWLASRQLENGCFRPDGHVFHQELQGGLNEEGEISNIALTAYIITSLLDTSLPPNIIRNSLSCLRALPPSKPIPSRVYAHALITYAFMKLRRYEESRSNEAEDGLKEDEELKVLVEFLGMAKRSGDYVWWETGNLATSVEATGYALLALSSCSAALRAHCARDVPRAARWLAAHLSPAGGMLSTQDTLIALEGLSRWRELLPQPSNITVTIRGPQVETIHLTADVTVPKILKMPASNQISVHVEGGGCALVQATRALRSAAPAAARSALRVRARVRCEGAFDCRGDVCFCAAVVEVCTLWSGSFPPMSLMEVTLPSGFAPDAERLYAQLANNTLLRRIELSPTGKASLYLGTRDGSDTMSRVGRHCLNIHAVGPRARTKPAYVKIIDYYRPYIKDTQMYTIPEDCPSPITNHTNNYHASDNLFNKARSLTDSGEIIITHDYSFEDIPEGIPLDDPVYDNLIKVDGFHPQDGADDNDILLNQNYISENRTGGNNNKTKATEDNKTNKNLTVNDNAANQNTIKNIDTAKGSVDKNKKVAILTLETINNEENIKIENVSNNTSTERAQDKERVQIVKDIQLIESTTVANKNAIKNEIKQSSDGDIPSHFHVIDTEKDLDVPTGVEGPIPAIVLPPKNFIPPANTDANHQPQSDWRAFPAILYEKYYQPVYYEDYTRRTGVAA